MEPTILTGTKPGMKVRDEEVFGPVVVIEPYNDYEEALSAVNHSKYGLQAGLMTRDAGRILTAYRELGGWRAHRWGYAQLASRSDAVWRREGFGTGPRRHSLSDSRDDGTAHAGDGGDWLESTPKPIQGRRVKKTLRG